MRNAVWCTTHLTRMGAYGTVLVALVWPAWRATGAAGPENRSAQVRFVSPQGSDEAAGDAGHPWATIGRALKGARPGDTIRLLPGTFSERVEVKTSGLPGQPIVLEGTRGPRGEWQSIIDPSVPLAPGWTPAPEVGPGVYKMPYPGFEPFLMLVDGKFIPRVWPDHMADGEGFEKMAWAPDKKVDTYGGKEVCYWDVMGAMYGNKDGAVYLRFRDRDDPNTKRIRVAPQGGSVEIADQSWIVLRNLFVQGGQFCVRLKGPRAVHNVVEDCRLVNASERITLQDGAAHNLVRGNVITAEFYSDKCRTGAWGTHLQGDAIPYELGLKFLFYHQYKMFFGPNGTSDYGIRVDGGSDNEIAGNQVLEGGQGIHLVRSTAARVHDNVVRGLSSIGIIVTMDRVFDVRVHDNLIIDSNLAFRIHHVNEPGQKRPRSVYLYRNRCWQPAGVGSGIFFHFNDKNDVEPYPHPTVWFYHNSFAGGRSGTQVSGYAERLGALPKTYFVNNVFSAPLPVYASSRFMSTETAWGAFDYNWVGGVPRPGVWYGPHNVTRAGKTIWEVAARPDFLLPAECGGRAAGLDLSAAFELNGRRYQPLPGMEPRYFRGSRPDLGAVQPE